MIKHKDDVYEWFKHLDATTRIDVMCSIFYSCSPFEIRFFGTCIENLAKKDYHALKDTDLQAVDISSLQDSNINILKVGPQLRSRLIISLCLLKSRPGNPSCVNMLSDLLSRVDQHLALYQFDSTFDHRLIEDVRLLLMVAVHHPAFSFNQRQEFINQMENFNRVFSHLFDQPSSKQNCSCQTEETLLPDVR